jgi:hypothetical protein
LVVRLAVGRSPDLLLIDTIDLPELIVAAAAAAIAASGFELAREHHVAGVEGAVALDRAALPAVLNVPSDVLALSKLALRQLLRPNQVNGEFRSVPFRPGAPPSPRALSDLPLHPRCRRSLALYYGSASPLFPDAPTIRVGQRARMAALQGRHHVSKRSVALIVIGVALTLLGLLWFLQGAGAVHIRPILCVSNCKPVTKSTGWLITGVVACIAGVAIAVRSARHLRRRRDD